MSSEDVSESGLGDVPDDAVYGQLLTSCVAHANWYTSTPNETYFMVRHDVMVEFSNKICHHYKNRPPACDDLRGEAYADFYQWFKSDDFVKNASPEYTFTDIFLVGSSWTPLRDIDSTIDVFIYVKTGKEKSNLVIDKARDYFVEAMCKNFPLVQELIVRKNVVSLQNTIFDMKISFSVDRVIPPFGVRLNSALNQYDDFLENFSASAYFLHSWFKQIKKHCKGTEIVVVPSSTSINYLWIYFLQFYELVPQFFSKPGSSCRSSLLNYKTEDIVKYKLNAYSPELYHFYKYFDRIRTDRKPLTGEILTMFFFFYGYLIDLPHVQLDLINTKADDKCHTSCEALIISDSEVTYGSEIPDAHRLQFLFRQAFYAIKDCQEPRNVLKTLLKMNFDKSFNLIRDRITREDPNRYANFNKAYVVVLDSDEKEQKYHSRREANGFIVMDCGDRRRYQWKKGQTRKIDKRPKIIEFSDELHTMKSCFKKPAISESDEKTPDLEHLRRRAEGMFMTTILPNPNNFSELCVLFRPPRNLKKKLIPVVENDQSGSVWNGKQLVKNEGQNEPGFFELAQTACYQELKEFEDIRKLHFLIDSQHARQEELTVRDFHQSAFEQNVLQLRKRGILNTDVTPTTLPSNSTAMTFNDFLGSAPPLFENGKFMFDVAAKTMKKYLIMKMRACENEKKAASKKIPEKNTSKSSAEQNLIEETKINIRAACPKLDMQSGVTNYSDFVEHLTALEESWMQELESLTDDDSEYTQLNRYY